MTLASEEFWQKQQEIPGSTRVPVDELKQWFPNKPDLTIYDLGSGSGRSTGTLQNSFPESKVVAFDISASGLQQTNKEITGRVQGTVLELPYKNESADGIVLCGVLTNITDKNPENAIESRNKIMNEIKRVLKPGGLAIVSDFSNDHSLSGYNVNYKRHELITKEYGTIAVFDSSAKITFEGKSDEEVSGLRNSPDLKRFARHYSPNEIAKLAKDNNLTPVDYKVEKGKTPSGNPIDTLIFRITK
jgi:ubiquinone/menaquinone biosynthesis C-methylase UbiE